MKTLRLYCALAVALMACPETSFAQCRSFTKNSCLPNLAPYTSNGQYSGATLFQGESATIIQTFYAEQDYRLLVCTQESLGGNVTFSVLDEDENLLYSNKESKEAFWDFKVESTRQLSIVIDVPSGAGATDLKREGCVSIMVGFKP